jgi:Rrf2 family protein
MRPMLLNLTAVYGLRAMATLAGLGAGETLNASELSERTGVPQQYLSKVMRKLVVGKLVHSQRGRGGGFGLARPAAKIPLTDVLRAIDIELDGGCAFGYGQCDPDNPCVLHPIWTKLQQGLDAWTNGCTMADLGAAPADRTRRRR